MLILDSVIPQLMKDEEKRFTYVEMKFFQMWWRNQSD
jgi:alpha-mannosidase